jgi:eukaryotic-like serine/threonine-protein kinase
MSVTTEASKQLLKMVTCGGCGAKVFISGELLPLQTVPCTKCSHPLMMPLRLRQFELLMPIASGGMGTVYRAHDTTLHREVAVKLMKKEVAADPKSLENFYQEARSCACLNHTNIIHIYTFDECDGQRYLVMELADCGSLDNRIEREQRLPELDVLDIGIQVASALAAALRRNIIHRDIKPGNILFNAEGEPKLIDFGLARRTESELQEEAVWGTPYYIAPEKIKQEQEDFLSDMYSLAGTLYHALTGHVPFEAPSIDDVLAAHIHTPVTPPQMVVPDITAPTSEALVKAMAKRPADRFKSYDEFIMALTAARSQLLVSQLTQSRSIGGGGRHAGGKSWWRRS